jgi:hypothetical protein
MNCIIFRGGGERHRAPTATTASGWTKLHECAKEGKKRVELIDETFGLVHRASAHLLHSYNGSLHFEHSLPKNSEVTTRDLAAANRTRCSTSISIV